MRVGSNLYLCLVALCAIGCVSSAAAPAAEHATASPAPAPAPIFPPLATLPSAELIARHGTGQQAYALTAAEWLADVPVAVNEDYDFATAMTLDVGPGLAAGKRLKLNRDKAASLVGFSLPAATLPALDAARARGVHVYALFWGPAEAAEVRIVRDRFDGDRNLLGSSVTTLPARPLTGERGWAESTPELGHALEAAAGKPAESDP